MFHSHIQMVYNWLKFGCWEIVLFMSCRVFDGVCEMKQFQNEFNTDCEQTVSYPTEWTYKYFLDFRIAVAWKVLIKANVEILNSFSLSLIILIHWRTLDPGIYVSA